MKEIMSVVMEELEFGKRELMTDLFCQFRTSMIPAEVTELKVFARKIL